MLGAIPPDARERCCQTGYLQAANEESTPLDDGLEAFLAEGPPPVYVGFGSMISADPAATAETVFAAARATGLRFVVSAGWGAIGALGPAEAGASARVHVVGAVPHRTLFPRVAAVVHHGGAGTTAVAARAARAGPPRLRVAPQRPPVPRQPGATPRRLAPGCMVCLS